MLETLRNAWKVKEIRNKILFTVFIILIFRIGSVIPVPYIDVAALKSASESGQTNEFFSYLSILTGGGLEYGAIFAMSVTPYINSSIIVQLLCVAIPALERLSKEGEEGQKKLAQITRYVTVGLALIQGTAYFFYLKNSNYLSVSGGAVIFAAFVIILAFTAGSALVMWLGEQIDVKGIGNGISILLFAGIISRGPQALNALVAYWKLDQQVAVVGIVLLFLAVIVFIVWMTEAERRIPVQYAKRVVGNKMYGGQNTHIPIKVNMSGVMPIIFAGSILSIPPTIQMFIPSAKLADSKFWTGFFKVFTSTHWAYGIIYFILIIAFAYFYSSIQYNPIEMSQNIAKNGGMIPGIRTGRPTSDYIARIISRITLLGALLLSVVAIFPIVFSQLTTLILTKTTVYADGMNVSLGGTSIIILVGVALETVKQLESQMMMRHYKGFLD